ncbi:MAG: DNA gyrase subunit A [Candidatus Tyloplasma litorale]|nr:MAG: DNA gyrase subunit A [Mycoplasmatales bacterium]
MDEKLPKQNIQDISISNEMESSFIDYAMSVIVSRAIPDVRDGLKPVHRRILYAMNGLEMTHNKSFKKSARAVGEVIAKYHPHGDTAVYDSLVRMAQPHSLRYPLVWGQGNFGSIDGDSAAAMRYTEAKLKKISSLMLEDIKKDTVDFRENYDGSEVEPSVLPGKIPNLLINGSTGIAVGMATSIPPHNLNEVLNAAQALLKNPELEVIDLINYVKAPDFPTGGIIVNKNELYSAYKTGHGRAIVRAKTKIMFDGKKNHGTIIVEEIPYMVNKANLILRIADLVKNKTIESISNIKDESNRKGIRIVIKLKRGFIPEVELNKLFKLTPLQSNSQFNMLALVNNRPEILNLKSALNYYNQHQIDVLVRKTKFELNKLIARKHILDGLHIALKNVDEVIAIIKKSRDNVDAINSLMKRFEFSETQAKAVVDMRLGRLTNLETHNLIEELKKIQKLVDDCNLVLNSENEQIKRVIRMFDEIKDSFGDERRTELSNDSLSSIDDEDLIPNEDVVVTISKKGYVKRLPVDQYRVQNRGGTGSRGAVVNDGDYIENIIVTNTHTDLMFFTTLGKVFRIRTHKIPESAKNTKGLPVVNLIELDKNRNENVSAVISIDDYENSDLLFITENGLVKKTKAIKFKKINRRGKIAISLKKNNLLIGVTTIPSNENTQIILGNSNGKAIRFNSSDVRHVGRTASGVIGMNVNGGKIVDYSLSNKGKLILSISEKGFGKLTNIDNYRVTKRGAKGVATINKSKSGELIGLLAVNGNEHLIIITNKGTVIRLKLKQISNFSRNSKGVKIVKLREEEKIASISIIRSLKEIEEEIEEKTNNDSNNKIDLKEAKEEKTPEQQIETTLKDIGENFDDEI